MNLKIRHQIPEYSDSKKTSEEDLIKILKDLDLINNLALTSKFIISKINKIIKKKNLNYFSLLDIGGGSGNIAVSIAKWARKKGLKSKITIVDIDPIAIKLAKHNTKKFPEINLIKKNILKYPFKENFDFIISVFTFHHFKNRENEILIKKIFKKTNHMILLEDIKRDMFS
ncbi:methyltransferase domain-containing protein, partial [Candidatus Pacearchaeota archaeon]|nr:methyltransferase domain-containing protein [Candidatus Pacearchaeota archaeon]MBD3283672.1 methyltransferase domain-containing protein [Candidatus Pacearchaeota archaeon]